MEVCLIVFVYIQCKDVDRFFGMLRFDRKEKKFFGSSGDLDGSLNFGIIISVGVLLVLGNLGYASSAVVNGLSLFS